MRNESGSPARSICTRSAREATATSSNSLALDSITANATARYIDPVSMYSSPSSRASIRPSVDLPEADGPSIAIIRGWAMAESQSAYHHDRLAPQSPAVDDRDWNP